MKNLEIKKYLNSLEIKTLDNSQIVIARQQITVPMKEINETLHSRKEPGIIGK